jgi:hypothetical protein
MRANMPVNATSSQPAFAGLLPACYAHVGAHMFIALRKLLATILVLVSGVAWCADIESAAPPVEVVRAEFGTFPKAGESGPLFKATRFVPLVPGQSYGWIAIVKPTSEKVRWREEFTLPAAPTVWDGEKLPSTVQSLSADRRTSITEGEAKPVEGAIFNAWSVAPGDPVGSYRIRVFIENRLVGTFDFEVR